MLICFGLHLKPGFFSGLLCKREGNVLSQSQESMARNIFDGCLVDKTQLTKDQVQYLLSLLLLPSPPPAVLSFSISSFRLFLLPEVSLSQRTQAFLTWLQRFNDWCVQTSISSRDDMHPAPPLKPSSTDIEYVLPVLSAPVSLPVSHLH